MNPPTPIHPLTHEMLQRMEEKILTNRPQIEKIQSAYGTMSYFDYIKQKNRVNPNKHSQERKKEIIEVIKSETKRLLGSAIAEEVERQLKKNDSISTAEHTSPIGTAHTLNAALSTAIPMFGNEDPRFRNVIILSCSGVSFNNDLSFSRGFQFHVFKEGKVDDSQIAFFGRSYDPKMVLYSPPYGTEEIEEMQKRLIALKTDGTLTPQLFEKIEFLINNVYTTPHAYTGKDYVDQLTITNYYLWKNLFPNFAPKHIPNYVMLSQEKILLKLLTEYHLDSPTPIHNFLFNSTYNDLTEKYFDGITGAFNKEAGTGTFLFWGLSEDGYRMQLFRQNQELVSKDGSYRVALTPEAIRAAIKNKELVPGLLLTFIVLSFYYGLLLGGGASQTTYLTAMKNAYMKMTKELGDLDSFEDSQDAVTDDFVFYRPHLAFIESAGERISATGLDMYLYQNPSGWKNVLQATKTLSVNDFITILLPILYKQFCPDDQKEDVLMNISRFDVEKFIGFDQKLPPLGIV